ncbi:class I SAM-dependent methyltransferase [Blastococcus sp. CCUG 61487]|uniref:class I SAM-dependent methyltransferase n=1 Tax=Blastococcus sp. CCUG 61487 TaxID=1840703 RepID=UPI00113504F4|nr:class I SAM-dependent methyltransferase [Blastococcus sp. CCUG 61487]TKJ20516.1 methyltransferase type 11 [Blastococcus sp. CCUG 61487]
MDLWDGDFWDVHRDLPREGVGSDATTRRLLELAGPLPDDARALDLGCGPGRSALVLAAAGMRVTGVDLHLPFLVRLREAASARGLAGSVSVERASMAALPHPDGCVDAVWSEGAAYAMGVDAALVAWRRLLRPGGVLVFTDVGWATATPSAAAWQFWAAYPAMRTASATVEACRAAGYDVVATLEQPESDWWDEYYDPLGERLDALERAHPDAADRLAPYRAEITLRREHGADYAYTAFVLRRP